MVELFAGTDREGGSLFGMKRTAGHKIMTRPAQWHSGVDDLDEVNPVEQLIKELLGYASSHNPKG
jgi:hypothetical protein